MTTSPALSPAALSALSGADLTGAAAKITDKSAARDAKIKNTATDFEAMFINSMFQQMFAHVGEGPFGGGPGAKIWQSFLTDEYSKSFVKKGGIGLAAQVQRELLAQQEIR
jgi:Rod binding domain-containing protein